MHRDSPSVDIMPNERAGMLQRAWERRQRVLRAVHCGAKQTEVAKFLGLSQSRVHQMYSRALKERTSPAEFYLSRGLFVPEFEEIQYLCLRKG